jgi:hypothetical protein
LLNSISMTQNLFHWNCSTSCPIKVLWTKGPHCGLLFWPLYRTFCYLTSILKTFYELCFVICQNVFCKVHALWEQASIQWECLSKYETDFYIIQILIHIHTYSPRLYQNRMLKDNISPSFILLYWIIEIWNRDVSYIQTANCTGIFIRTHFHLKIYFGSWRK